MSAATMVYEAISNFVYLVGCFAFGYLMGIGLIYLAQSKEDDDE